MPAPWPMLSMVMAGCSVHSVTTVVRIAAPVGVVSSPVTGAVASGTPCSKTAVAGAGIGIRPCSHFTMPLPGGTDRLVKRSTPSKSRPMAEPTMSAILSRAPTSWKCTLLQRNAVHACLGRPEPAKDAGCQLLLGSGEGGGANERFNFRKMPIGRLIRRFNLDVGAGNAGTAFGRGLERERQAEGSEAAANGVGINASVDECRQGHVAADAAKAVEMSHAHGKLLQLGRRRSGRSPAAANQADVQHSNGYTIRFDSKNDGQRPFK